MPNTLSVLQLISTKKIEFFQQRREKMKWRWCKIPRQAIVKRDAILSKTRENKHILAKKGGKCPHTLGFFQSKNKRVVRSLFVTSSRRFELWSSHQQTWKQSVRLKQKALQRTVAFYLNFYPFDSDYFVLWWYVSEKSFLQGVRQTIALTISSILRTTDAVVYLSIAPGGQMFLNAQFICVFHIHAFSDFFKNRRRGRKHDLSAVVSLAKHSGWKVFLGKTVLCLNAKPNVFKRYMCM